MTAHPLLWQSPQPLWLRLGSDAATAAAVPAQAQPAILRFASDTFMDQMLATLARDPSALHKLVARPETWRKPMRDAPDMLERTPLPRRAQASARHAAALRRSAPLPLAATQEPLKLYQPAHQRYYLVGASLICGIPGLPEHSVARSGAEEIHFVLRRHLPATGEGGQAQTLHEFAYIKDENGARWQRCSADAQADQLVPGEERLPVFPLGFQDDASRGRTVWAGLVPVGRREEYLGAQVDQTVAPAFALGQRQSMSDAAPPPARNSTLARMVQFQMDVAEPWKVLIRSSYKLAAELNAASPISGDSESDADKRRRVFAFNLQQQSASWLILLDCADHLDTYLHDLWQVIENNGAGFDALSTPRKQLYTWLGSASLSEALKLGLKASDAGAPVRPPAATLRDALKAVRAPGVREKLEASTATYTENTLSLEGWPPFHFVLAGLNNTRAADGPYLALDTLAASSGIEPDPLAGPVPGQSAALKVDRYTALFARALEPSAETDAPPLPFALQVRNALSANLGDLRDGGWFSVRFVYTSRDCGPLHPPLLSAATQRFKLASFFDADAPARPIRISLPVDTSPAGLRKFNRNTAFVMSDMLCGQVQRAKGLGLVDLVRSVLPWPLHKALDVGEGGPCQTGGGINIGMICSLSIPIITICALILLIIIVSLLDLIFRWLPYFVMCFPIPGLKGKKP